MFKKFISALTIALLTGLPFSTLGQKLSVMPYAGVNVSNIQVLIVDTRYSLTYSPQAGMLLENHFNPKWSLLSGVAWSQKGFLEKYEASSWGHNARITHKLDYLEVPLLARISWKQGRINFIAQMGPYAAYWLNYSANRVINGTEMGKGTINIKNQQRIDIGLISSVGVKVSAGPGKLVFELRYSHGMGGLINHRYPLASSGLSHNPIPNKTASLLAGYSFVIK